MNYNISFLNLELDSPPEHSPQNTECLTQTTFILIGTIMREQVVAYNNF